MSHKWQNILIKSDATIEEALGVINEGAFQIALVVDENQYLLGTVSDGDIRRALINKVPLSTFVSEIMFTTPKTALASSTRRELLAIMDQYELSVIPLLLEGRVVGLEKLHQVLHKPKYDNPVFLMAGGFGTRLRPLTDNCPKPLLKIGDKPLLETTLLHMKRSGFYQFYISTHFLPEMIREHFGNGDKWDVNITYVHESNPLGTGGALGLLPEEIPQLPLIMMNGDVLTNMDFVKLLDFHNKENADATMCVREYKYQVPYGVVHAEDNRIVSMVEKPTHCYHVNTGIYIINPIVFNSVSKNKVIDMPTVLEEQIEKNKIVSMYTLYAYWLDVGRMDDFNRAQSDIKGLGF